MKFTKDEAYKELVARMTAKGEKLNLSERSINEQLENLISLVATDETEMSDFVEKILPLIKTADNNIESIDKNTFLFFKKSPQFTKFFYNFTLCKLRLNINKNF